jgi:hypothetical protein
VIFRVPNAKTFIIGGDDFERFADWRYRSGLSPAVVASVHESVLARLSALAGSEMWLRDAVEVITKELLDEGLIRS